MTEVITSVTSIERLRVYQASRGLEDKIYELVKRLPAAEFYGLGNDLRRSSGAISHHVAECHRRYSYSAKLASLHLARTEAEKLKQLLATFEGQGFGNASQLQQDCTGIGKQCWGLITYIKRRQDERQRSTQARASDELVAARA